MKIVDLEAIPVAYPEPNDAGNTRYLLLVRITADTGQLGWGEAVTMWPEATLATRVIVDALATQLIGRDPREHAAIHHELSEHMWWYGVGGIASFALSAIDIALWDLAGQAENVPLIELLGGTRHESLPVLVSCHAMLADLKLMAGTMAGWVAEHQAVGIKVGFGKRGPAELGVDPERDTEFVAELRQALGPGPSIMIDIGASIRWDVPTAIDRARRFADYAVAWLEEPLGADDPAGYRRLGEHTDIKIAYGEREWTPRGVQRIVETGTVEVVGVDPGRCEGITGWLEAQRHTATGGVEINAHAWSSAIVTSASLALSLASPNCRQIEIKPLPNPMQHELVSTPITEKHGRMGALTGPGLGLIVDEAALERYRWAGVSTAS